MSERSRGGCRWGWLAWAVALVVPVTARAAQPDGDLSDRVARFCGACHALPRPASFRRSDWHGRIRLAYEYHARSGRTDLDPPAIAAVTRWYVDRAPVALPARSLPAADSAVPVRFDAVAVAGPDDGRTPGTADVRWAVLPEGPRLVVADMLRGEVVAVDPRDPVPAGRPLVAVPHPCRVRAAGDGLVVADLGSVDAFDHARGRALRLLPGAAGAPWSQSEIVAGLGRVADVLPWGAAGDGAMVAEFGFHRTGSLLVAPVPGDDARPAEPHRLDLRAGAVELAPLDADGDGRLDVLALFGQEHESLEAFLDRGDGRFERHTLWRGVDLALGSSSLSLADMDGDGDDDILLTHGDAFDNRLVTPWHGVQWLERGPGLAITPHWLLDLPGAYRARGADFDGDGDTDIVVATWLPADTDAGTLPPGALPSLVLLEARGAGRFAAHVLERDRHAHPALEVGDFDGDGDADLAVGTHGAGLGADGSRLTLWWNRGAGR